jgi:hypothetical protein
VQRCPHLVLFNPPYAPCWPLVTSTCIASCCCCCPQGYSNSAHELRRMVVDSLDVLFAMELPVPTEILSMHMEGIEAVLDK